MHDATTLAVPRAARLEGWKADLAASLLAALVMVATQAAAGFPTLFDSGGDNDSVMRLVQIRDWLEARSLAWQARADRVGSYLHRLKAARGRLVPYLFGVVDVNLVLVALHRFGLPNEIDPYQLRAWVETLVK